MTSNARELAQIPSTPSGRKNIAINGAMKIAQRGTLTGQTGNSYTACDRFLTAEGGAAVTTSSQSTDVPSGQGFANSLKIAFTTADTDISANDFFLLIQRLEGQDLQHLLYGTSDAKDLTISFWVKSPKTGTHILELRHNDASPAYYNGQAYTITSANTWQKVTLTYSGYVTTAFDDDNNQSLAMQWWFAAGSNFSSGTLQSNTWQNTATNRAVGQVNCLDSTDNEIYLTGVQLEVGSVATEFEHRSFGEELQLCQRYYQQYTNPPLRGVISDPNANRMGMPLPVIMRATPTVTITSTGTSGHFPLYDGVNTAVYISTIASYCSPDKLELDFDTNPNLTVGNAGCVFQADANASDFGISAEL